MSIKKLVVVDSTGLLQQLQNNDTVIGQSIVTLTDGSTITLDCGTTSRFLVTSIAGNRTIAFNNDADGSQFWLTIGQDSTGGRTLAWPAGIRWFGGATGTPLATASKLTQFAFVRIASNSYYGFQINES